MARRDSTVPELRTSILSYTRDVSAQAASASAFHGSSEASRFRVYTAPGTASTRAESEATTASTKCVEPESASNPPRVEPGPKKPRMQVLRASCLTNLIVPERITKT